MSRRKGVRTKRTDLPHLVNVRDTLVLMIERVDRWRAPERNAGMKLAYGLVRDQLTQDLRSVEELIAYAQRDRGCGGGTPAVKAQGCAASAVAANAAAVAVGPAPKVSQGSATASPADPLLLGPTMQELPVLAPALSVDIISIKEANP